MCAALGLPLRVGSERLVRAPMGRQEGLLLVVHGSQCHRSAAEAHELAGMVAGALPDTDVDVGFLEMADPPAGESLDAMVARGARRVVVLPLVLLGAGHAKSDVPAVVLGARQRHADIDIGFGSPLGISRGLVEVLGSRLLAQGAAGLPLLLVARCTSDPDANGDACKAARLVAEWTGACFAHCAFSGVTGPSIPDALEVFERLGHRRIAVAWWFLCHGKLIERGREEIAAFAERTGTEVIDAGHIGGDPRLVPLITAKYYEALEGMPAVNCDACAYRAPWPGREGRVGQPLGVGHSHLAADHMAGLHRH
ncbi:MAG: sirohydrochlorin chelatase [Acidimicrobiales bacterium]